MIIATIVAYVWFWACIALILFVWGNDGPSDRT